MVLMGTANSLNGPLKSLPISPGLKLKVLDFYPEEIGMHFSGPLAMIQRITRFPDLIQIKSRFPDLIWVKSRFPDSFNPDKIQIAMKYLDEIQIA